MTSSSARFAIRPHRTVAFLVALPLLATTAAAAPNGGDVLSVLSYNVQGLFTLSVRQDARARVAAIGWLANRYDVVMVQEDFEYHGILTAQMPHKVVFRGNGLGWDPRRVAAKVLVTPFAILLPNFWPPYGAGVSTLIRGDLAVTEDVQRQAYGVCNGWLGDNGNCWANKGFLRVTARTTDGALIDVYNTHLDAGPSEGSVEVRRKQLDLLAEAIAGRGTERAVVVAGDFNIGFNRPGDREMMKSFRGRLGLQDSGAGAEIPFWRERDFILHRGGDRVTLHVEHSGEAQEFVSEDRALSDHPALYAVFHVEPRGTHQEGNLEPQMNTDEHR